MASNRVLLLGLYGVRKDLKAGGAITPGHLIKNSAAGVVVVHATAGGNALPMFALEREMTGDDKDVAYASNDTVLCLIPQPGSEINAILAAGASAIVVDDPLESAGDGTLRKHTPPSQAVAESGSASYTIAPKTKAIVAYATEAIDNSGGGTAVRIVVRTV